ncbi:DUF6340 family protein [uncultured Maribacter sp.]|uniref:DUF6340 family protein n=1 Tax=uncultured Maribacter sp. TaxID=431308 RepID=UPI00261D1539|nr:DUF6340 family protein [uncultured Maribacter sp.]
MLNQLYLTQIPMITLNRFFAFASIGLLLVSCSATHQLTMSAVDPAPVHIASDVQHIGIINRSLPAEGNSGIDTIDKILSAEGKNLDKDGAEAAIASVKSELQRLQRFDKVAVIKDIPEIKKGLGVLPASLSWDQVDKICKENDVDVLFSLAFYDTDTKASVKATEMDLPNPVGIKAKVPAVAITLRTQIQNGWRIYDPATKIILDEYSFNNNLVSSGSGINPMKAVKTIMNRKEKVVETSSHIGDYYAKRITPRSRRVKRDYFVKGTNNFEIAMRRAQTGKWNSAAELWEKEVSNPDGKIAGRACYNMAIINEINGDLNKALDWAQRSYSDYNIKEALSYVRILKYRMSQKRKLDKQLGK